MPTSRARSMPSLTKSFRRELRAPSPRSTGRTGISAFAETTISLSLGLSQLKLRSRIDPRGGCTFSESDSRGIRRDDPGYEGIRGFSIASYLGEPGILLPGCPLSEHCRVSRHRARMSSLADE